MTLTISPAVVMRTTVCGWLVAKTSVPSLAVMILIGRPANFPAPSLMILTAPAGAAASSIRASATSSTGGRR
ncbi:MAG TPA: hypothetical protein VGO71_20035 [Baekduia sp.]|nr:hypothetical protein [Baekduia sp.]